MANTTSFTTIVSTIFNTVSSSSHAAQNTTPVLATTITSTTFPNHTTPSWNNISTTALPNVSTVTQASVSTHNSSTLSPRLFSCNETHESRCLKILYEDIADSRVRIWDVLLFVPNTLFLIFVLYRMRHIWHRLLSGIGSGGSPIFVTYFVLVAITALVGVIRGIVSMTVDSASVSGGDANKILWVILRFFLLTAEMSVLVFGVAFGHLDSKTSIKRVLFVTTLLALIYSVIQCILELLWPDFRYEVPSSKWVVYGHGGALFSLITSLIFLLVYILVGALPFLKWLQKYLSVPSRKSFYVYVGLMAILNFISAVGSGMLLYCDMVGLCLIDVFSVVYFTCFAPLLYWTFLSSYFSNAQPNSTLFSYSNQVDEGLNDVADYDMPNNGITVDSTLSGILVFNHEDPDPYQSSNGLIEEPLRDFAEIPTSNFDADRKPRDSTHSYFSDDIT
uniref:Integral membrane protein GPR175 n=2 Tax=Ciona savignyi TaxID=51511 RepID=H2Z3W2_CIOSA